MGREKTDSSLMFRFLADQVGLLDESSSLSLIRHCGLVWCPTDHHQRLPYNEQSPTQFARGCSLMLYLLTGPCPALMVIFEEQELSLQ